MAAPKTAKDDKRLQAIIDTARQALQHLRDRENVPPELVTDISTHVKQSFSTLSSALVLKRAKEFNTLGTAVWNASAALLADFEEHADQLTRNGQNAAGVLLRLFALLLLDSSHAASARRKQDLGQQVRIFSIANRTAKLCLDRHQLELSVTALEIGSKHISPPAERPSLVQFDSMETGNLSDHELSMYWLERDFYLLRMLHAWKSKRHDLAEHFFLSWLKLKKNARGRATDSSNKAADLFYEFARELTKEEASAHAAKWYDRALAAFGDTTEQVQHENEELLASIAVAYVEALLKSGQSADLTRSREIISQLENVHSLGNRIVIPVLKVRVLASMKDVNLEEIRQALDHIIKHTVLTEDNFNMLMQTARKANKTASEVTLSALRTFILQRILPEVTSSHAEGEQICEWLEKATITYTMYATGHMATPSAEQVSDLSSLFDAIRDCPAASFSAKAAHAAQTLIWKATNGPDYAAARGCCQLLRHPLFDNAGYVNKGRIGRKIMRSALGIGELPVAREAFLAMPGNVQNEPATRYLTFQLALRQHDDGLATESLRIIVNHSSTDHTYLYACVLDAQQMSGSRHMAVAALRAIFDCRPPGLQVGTLLRCMARLLLAEMKSEGANKALVATEAVTVFEMAANSAQEIRKCPVEQWFAEVQWWSKNAYNLSIEMCSSIDPQQLVRLLAACMAFLDIYPKEPVLMPVNEIAKRKSLCLLLSATSLVVLGRASGEDHMAASAWFTKAQQTIAAFKQQLETADNSDEDSSIQTFTMLKFELECILRLRQWHLLDSTLHSCLELRTTARWDTLADLMIVIHEHLDSHERASHVALITQLLQKIINDTWKGDKNIVRVSRWLRFAFSLCMKHETGDFARKLLDQAARMAESGQRGRYDVYPEAELHWLATTGFNHAIDLSASSDRREDVVKWLDASLEVARWTQDNGALHAMLSHKRPAVEERLRSRSE